MTVLLDRNPYLKWRGTVRVITSQSRVLSSRLPAPEVPHWYNVGTDVPFENNWRNYPAGNQATLGYNPVSFMKDSGGWIHLRGMAENYETPGNTIFTLPVGFRPERIQAQPTRWSRQSEFEAMTLFIHADGRVDFNIPNTLDVEWVSLDNHRWKAA